MFVSEQEISEKRDDSDLGRDDEKKVSFKFATYDI